MKKLFSFILIVFISIVNLSAQDTIYFNKNWEKSLKDSAAFYRLQTKDSTGYNVIDYYINGIVQMTGHSTTSDSLFKIGYFKYYNNKGNLVSEGKYNNNKKAGLWLYYYEDGQLFSKINYNHRGKLDGDYIMYYPNGVVKREEYYLIDDFQRGKCFSAEGKEITYFPYEEMPEFKGGVEALREFLRDKTKYPKEARKKGIEGKIFATFYVNTKGEIEDTKILKSDNSIFDEEVIKVIKKMPKWKPGKQDGIPVRVEFNLPFLFNLPKNEE